NTLEVELRSAPTSALKISISGFMEPNQIPGAVHSKISHDSLQQTLPYVKGVIGVKFLEGMKVRLDETNQLLFDQNGLDLSLFNDWAKSATITKITRTFGGETYEKNDEIEAIGEERSGHDGPNGNLFYHLVLDESRDVWPLIEQIRALPFIEEAYPIFIPASSYPQFPLVQANTGTDAWKEILNLQGLDNRINFEKQYDSGVPTVALLDGRVAYHTNLKFTSSSTDSNPNTDYPGYVFNTENPLQESTSHATSMAGLLWGVPDPDYPYNYSGGLAYGASKPLFINTYSTGGPSLCKGTLWSNCDPTADSIALAVRKGAKVIVLEGWSYDGKTVENNWPAVKTAVWNATYTSGVSVIVPAGNIPCSPYPENSSGRASCVDKVVRDSSVSDITLSSDATYDTGSIIVGGVDPASNTLESTQLTGSNGLYYNVRYIHGATHRTGGLHGIDVTAPSTHVYKTTTDYNSNPATQLGSSGGGTSSAATAVGGIVALMRAVNPNLDNIQIRDLLRQTRKTDPDVSGTTITAGLVDAAAALCQANSQYCGGGGGFGTQSISTTPPANGSPDVNVWLVQNSQGVNVNPSQTLGIGINSQNLQDIQIEVDGQLMPIKQVAQNFVSFGLTPNLTPGTKDVLIHLAGGNVTLSQAIEVLAMPPLQEVQDLPTIGAIGATSFLIGAERYLTIDSFYNGSSFHTTSQLFKWNGSQFQLQQFIPTVGAYDMAPFSVGSEILAIANLDEGVFQAESKIMRWDGNQFVEIQSIPNHGAVDWEPFDIGGEHYLAVANYFNGTFDQTSVIYKWNGTNFSEYQTIATHGAHKWTHYTIGTTDYLALTTYVSGQQDTDSKLYKWDGHQFLLDQTFATDNDQDFKPFTIGDDHFAAIINNGNAVEPTQSKILKWDGSQFQDFQSFTTTGGRSWGTFEADGWRYLVLIQSNTNPQIYRWEGSRFELYRVIPMAGAFASEFFSLGLHDHRLILTSYEANHYQAPSKIYRFE
ncbi:MAG: S8 family serine peptidase, partial [Candidatus Sericytochromatia bacterium]